MHVSFALDCFANTFLNLRKFYLCLVIYNFYHLIKFPLQFQEFSLRKKLVLRQLGVTFFGAICNDNMIVVLVHYFIPTNHFSDSKVFEEVNLGMYCVINIVTISFGSYFSFLVGKATRENDGVNIQKRANPITIYYTCICIVVINVINAAIGFAMQMQVIVTKAIGTDHQSLFTYLTFIATVSDETYGIIRANFSD